MITILINNNIADGIRYWAKDEQKLWPEDTVYQIELADLLKQIDASLPTADDVRGIMSAAS